MPAALARLAPERLGLDRSSGNREDARHDPIVRARAPNALQLGAQSGAAIALVVAVIGAKLGGGLSHRSETAA